MSVARYEDAGDRSSVIAATALQLLFLLTFVAGYLNAMLRPSEESIFTAYRLMLPIVGLLIFVRYIRHHVTQQFLVYMLVVLVYSLVQMAAFGLLGDGFVWSYLINILAVIAFVYFVYVYQQVYGSDRLFRHLYFWYVVLVVASVHQLATGFRYPNAPYLDGVARIFFGQENDASLAIAAFMPVLLARSRRDPLALLLLLVGFFVIYTNSTRGIVVAVAMYPALLATAWMTSKLGGRVRVLWPLWASLTICALVGVIYLFKDVPIRLIGDDNGSLSTLLVDPVIEIATGQLMDAELTSINLRVTLVVVGIQNYLASYGFGIGPGASSYLALQWFDGIAGSMHVFPLQLLTENGWLFVGTMLWISAICVRRLGWYRFLPLFAYFNLISFSITSGAITNYYFFACAVFALTAGWPAAQSVSRGRDRSGLPSADRPVGITG